MTPSQVLKRRDDIQVYNQKTRSFFLRLLPRGPALLRISGAYVLADMPKANVETKPVTAIGTNNNNNDNGTIKTIVRNNNGASNPHPLSANYKLGQGPTPTLVIFPSFHKCRHCCTERRVSSPKSRCCDREGSRSGGTEGEGHSLKCFDTAHQARAQVEISELKPLAELVGGGLPQAPHPEYLPFLSLTKGSSELPEIRYSCPSAC